jgi:conjugal transfer pilus assembly protein TraF
MKMKVSARHFVFFLSFGLSTNAFSKDFLEDRERGWYWFEEHTLQDNNLDEKNPNLAINKGFDANKEMEKLQKSIKLALNLAILVPTESNIQNYLYYQIKAFNMSQRFTEAAKVLQVKYPALDYQIEAPYNHNARIIKNQEDRKIAENSMKQLAGTHGLFFFFDSVCPYCIVMAPIVVNFANKHGMHLIPVSVGGGVLKEFPNAVPDNGIATAYGVTHLPALFAVDPKTNNVLKLSNRVTSVTELEDIVLRHKMHEKDVSYGN